MIRDRDMLAKGETILVVEDEGIIAMHLQHMLTGFGFKVPVTVETGPDALLVVEQSRPDLVLMDIQLRGEMDGIETARQIREQYDMPVIYMTAYSEDACLLEARQTEPYGYLVKPFQDRELRATIEMALFKHKIDHQLRESESGYRELYHITPAMFHTTDANDCVTQVSDYWLSTLGYTRDEIVGRPITEFITPAARKYFLEVLGPEMAHTGTVRDAECQYLCKNGRALDVLFSTVGVFDEQGSLLRSHSALIDITARKHAENAERDQRNLAEALRDTASALNSTLSFEDVMDRILTNVGKVVPHDAVYIMMVEGGVAHINRIQGQHEWGSHERTMNLRWSVLETPYLRRMVETQNSFVLTDTSSQPGWTDDWIRSYAAAPIIGRGRLLGFINLVGLRPGFFTAEHASRLRAFADQAAVAIENARLYAEVERLATMDEVTGIANRRRLFELGQREFESSRRYNRPLCAILLDIDHFKKINDTYGHNAGDRVLTGIAKAISASVREIDVFGRYGGEEFVLLLPHVETSSAVEVAERLRKVVEDLRFTTERGVLQVTISLGVAQLVSGIPSLATLIDHADQAMYAAKQAGRNRVEVYL